MTRVTWTYSVEWLDPYTEPPADLPRIVATEKTESARDEPAPPAPDTIQQAWGEANERYQRTTGDRERWPYFIVVNAAQARKSADERTLYRRRRMKVARRILKQNPIDAEHLIRQKFTADPTYFGLTPEEAMNWSFSFEERS